MNNNRTTVGSGSTEIEWIPHYRGQAAQFRRWAADETVPEARHRSLDLARQYERLADKFEARITARDRAARKAL